MIGKTASAREVSGAVRLFLRETYRWCVRVFAPNWIVQNIEGVELLCLEGAVVTIRRYQPLSVMIVYPRQLETGQSD